MKTIKQLGASIGWCGVCVIVGLLAGLLTAEIIGLPLAFLLPFVLVRLARRRGKGVATLLWYCAGFALAAFHVAQPALFPTADYYATDRGMTLAAAGVMVLITLMIASASFLPAVRSRGAGARVAG